MYYILFLCVLALHSLLLAAADFVLMPGTLDELPEYFAQLQHTLNCTSSPLHMTNESECRAFILLHGIANTILEEEAWAPIGYFKYKGYYFADIADTQQSDSKCVLPKLKHTYETIINSFRSDWKKMFSPSRVWDRYKKSILNIPEGSFINAIIGVFGLHGDIRCEIFDTMLVLYIRRDKKQKVQEKLSFQLLE